jgi:hypothetical protein
VRTIHEALEHDRAIANPAQRPVRYSDIVPHHVQLRELGLLRKVGFFWMRNAHLASGDQE